MNIATTTASARIADPVIQIIQPQPAPAVSPKANGAYSEDARTDSERVQELQAELTAANLKLADDGNELRFEYDRDANRLIVRLVDLSTREVLRQFPSDDALRAARLIKSGKPLISLQA